jgi:hypothetical protein
MNGDVAGWTWNATLGKLKMPRVQFTVRERTGSNRKR